ncbi:HNH endonuclease [Xanthomonas rydalmerensis]|uniref:HNH endonuclease n=1 Tax=Xanthomonas rydalmerensis TaxID=3046274 RepID=A0ABZ0JK10_9XANT|nr:HNH endonuclease [Xanthomonas sp. DM-2023]WOS39980.1 HNH endonuclease [Xanthomonas sp. DM-2023]WOS44164.1 HNH endonuclease [Xanthomonas sp. DM-2023]WOS48344.1 HNH endonuclease [Xanthomonas sp. DM-2023]WOS52524.1 HNH endonuclease [Xanthomonas sp. DM-2023]WOS56708.1 HNH endonuclease [Xanthomonas sp. DM-2023]
MRAALRQRLLLAAQTDAQAQPAAGGWHSRCLHCRRRLDLHGDGEPLGHCSLEHVVPQAWFGRRAAAALCAQVGDDANDARNLALACAGCNHAKGRHHDARGPQDARARDVVATLLSARLARWRPPPAPTP